VLNAGGFDYKKLQCIRSSPSSFQQGLHNADWVTSVLETVKPAFSRRIVPAISFATHRACHVEFLEFALKCMAGILTTSIRVMQHTSCRSAAKPGPWSASVTISLLMRALSCQPMTSRLNKYNIIARYSQPSSINFMLPFFSLPTVK